jgi:cytochrome c556
MWRTTLAVILALLGTSSFAQPPALNRVMRTKLEHSQKILESVVTSNWAELEKHSQELQRLANDPAWVVLKTRDYARQSEAFLRATEDLIDAAKRRDLEAAPLAYVSMTMSCVQCHRHVARSRIAR